MEIIIWLGIVLCLCQSAIFSGLNLAFFSLSRLRLEIEATHGNQAAQRVLAMRADSNFLLSTILWGNVGVNVLLALLSNSVLTGVSAFLFSTFFIAMVGELMPQAYFSRNALQMAARLTPLLKFYQWLLYPLAKSSAKLLDWWLGRETIQYLKEKSIKELIRTHMAHDDGEIDYVEGIGAINFLSLDDLLIGDEGHRIDPDSIIPLPQAEGRCMFPAFTHPAEDRFLQSVARSKKRWVIFTNEQDQPQLVMNADAFLRDAFMETQIPDPLAYCHQPIVVHDSLLPLGDVFSRFKMNAQEQGDDLLQHDIILLWGREKQIITGSDILGRLLRGIARHAE
jgi:hypothetical protein